MKKIIITTLVASSLLLSAETTDEQEQIKNDIAKTKAHIQELDIVVKDLEARLPAEAPNENIMTHAELGFIQTRGNTETKAFNLDLDAKKAWANEQVTFLFDGQYAEDQGKESKNKFLTELAYSHTLTNKLSATYLLGYKKDKFSGFAYQAYTGPGLKYNLLETSTQNLNIEGNILYSADDIEDINFDEDGNIIEYPNTHNTVPTTIIEGELNKYAAYRVNAIYGWQMLENLKFDQEISYRADIEDTEVYYVYSKTAFSSKISDMFSAGISYKVDYMNTPPYAKEYTDRTFSANLIIDY